MMRFVELTLETLSYDAQLEIMAKLDPESILQLCQTSSKFREICSKDRTWRYLMRVIYPLYQPTDDPRRQFQALTNGVRTEYAVRTYSVLVLEYVRDRQNIPEDVLSMQDLLYDDQVRTYAETNLPVLPENGHPAWNDFGSVEWIDEEARRRDYYDYQGYVFFEVNGLQFTTGTKYWVSSISVPNGPRYVFDTKIETAHPNTIREIREIRVWSDRRDAIEYVANYAYEISYQKIREIIAEGMIGPHGRMEQVLDEITHQQIVQWVLQYDQRGESLFAVETFRKVLLEEGHSIDAFFRDTYEVKQITFL